MATLNAIRGLFLEEAVLYLLGTSGYHPVVDPGSDPTLRWKSHGLNVVGRGENHQIDAIGDFFMPPPFSHPQRLLVEAKYHTSKPTGIEVIRNAVGVLKDVSEYWFTAPAPPPTLWPPKLRRYHYQYAVVSSTGFAENAERYAFAQDITLIQVHRSRFFTPVLSTIGNVTSATFGSQSDDKIQVKLSELRESVRSALMGGVPDSTLEDLPSQARHAIASIANACAAIQIGLLVVSPTGCQILMVANPDQKRRIREMSSAQTDSNGIVGQIAWDYDSGGFIVRAGGHDILSFDTPTRILELALEQHGLLVPDGLSGDLIIEVLFMDTDNRTRNHDASHRSATLIPLRLPRAELDKFLANQQKSN